MNILNPCTCNDCEVIRLNAAIETLTREKSALEEQLQETRVALAGAYPAFREERARAEAAEKALDDLHEKLQAIGEEFGVDGGEERTAGIRRVLTEQKAHIADAAEVIRPFHTTNTNGLVTLRAKHIDAARAWTDKHDKGKK